LSTVLDGSWSLFSTGAKVAADSRVERAREESGEERSAPPSLPACKEGVLY